VSPTGRELDIFTLPGHHHARPRDSTMTCLILKESGSKATAAEMTEMREALLLNQASIVV
jgi:hypothetical protein